MTLAIRLPQDLEKKLALLCEQTKRNKSFYVREALAMYLEDLDDYYTAIERVNDPKRQFISTEQLLDDLNFGSDDKL